MTLKLSLYLDLVRFLAAFAVFVGHIATPPFTSNVFWRGLPWYGDVAVTIFFVLSGYVISYTTSNREGDLTSYAVSRISRLYSVVFVALAVTALLDFCGQQLNPQFYSSPRVLLKQSSFEGYVASALFVNEYQVFGFNGISPGTNGPYWSLSFEATYYVIAGLLMFVRPLISIPVVLLILFAAGRTVGALLPLWYLGYFIYRIPKTWLPELRKSAWVGVISATAVALLVIPAVARTLPADNFGIALPWGRGQYNRNILQDYAAGLAFAVHLIAAGKLFKDHSSGVSYEQIVRRLGSLTFPLYLIHYPLVCFLCALGTHELGSFGNAACLVVGVFLIVYILTPMCDAIRDWMRCKLKKVLAPSSGNKTSARE